jgi:hypothetical protein
MHPCIHPSSKHTSIYIYIKKLNLKLNREEREVLTVGGTGPSGRGRRDTRNLA